MAIYHFSVQVIGRKAGRSAVSAAAYRAGERLHDERLDRDHDFRAKSGVVHSEVMLPEGAPEQWRDRERLWNDVEAFEKRKDAQLAREVEFAIPSEMSQVDGIALARDFVAAEFVDRGMIADLNVHWDMGADGQPKPHAHVMLTMREVGPDGFGDKVREWNDHTNVARWRERWCTHVNARLAELDIDARIDHRSLRAQGVDLEPQSKIGAPAQRMSTQGLEADRTELHREIARANGERILANPGIALDAITHQQATFTNRDLAIFVHRHSDGQDQFNTVMRAVRASPDLIALGQDDRGDDRFTSRAMIETEGRLEQAADRLAAQHDHGLPTAAGYWGVAAVGSEGLHLGDEQQAALAHVTGGSDLAIVTGYAGTGKSAMLGIARDQWEAAGYRVRGAALSGIAAEGLENGSGIASRTIARLEHGWAQGRDLLGPDDVLVIDEAGMVGTRQLERVLSHAADAGAKVVLVGDAEQLQAIEAGAAFRSIQERHGGVEITEVRRQQEGWQQDATRYLATGRTGDAIQAYADHGMVHAADTREQARGELIERWDRERIAAPDQSRIILTHTNTQVRELNEAARDRMRAAGALGDNVRMTVERGERDFAAGDRVMFLRNERSLGVKNGTLATIEQMDKSHMAVRSDDGRKVAFDIKDYCDLDHGYAATIHKAQGMTVDRAHVLATPGMDRHGAYVGLSRHRDGVDLHYGRDDFADQGKLVRTLSRERAKDMASDYAKADPAQHPSTELRRAFAERRGIRFRERLAEIARRVVPEKVRGMFDGLDLRAIRRSEPTAQPERPRGMFADFRPNAPIIDAVKVMEAERENVRHLAVQRHARAISAIQAMQEKDLPVLPHQNAELGKARAAMDAIAKHAAQDMEEAFRRDGSLVPEAAKGDTRRAVRAMRLEADVRSDPGKRADRFVETWQKLDRQRTAAYARDDHDAFRQHRTEMGRMAKSLERDPQLESVLRGRDRRDLGLDMNLLPHRQLSHDLASSIGHERGRSMGMSL